MSKETYLYRGNVQIYLQGEKALLPVASGNRNGQVSYFIGSKKSKLLIRDFRSLLTRLKSEGKRVAAYGAAAKGATALGFILWPRSPRYVTPAQVREIVAELPAGVTTVGVFVSENFAAIVKEARG